MVKSVKFWSQEKKGVVTRGVAGCGGVRALRERLRATCTCNEAVDRVRTRAGKAPAVEADRGQSISVKTSNENGSAPAVEAGCNQIASRRDGTGNATAVEAGCSQVSSGSDGARNAPACEAGRGPYISETCGPGNAPAGEAGCNKARSGQPEEDIEHRVSSEVRKHINNYEIANLINKKLKKVCYKKYMYKSDSLPVNDNKLHANLITPSIESSLNCIAGYGSNSERNAQPSSVTGAESCVGCIARYGSSDREKQNRTCEVCRNAQNDDPLSVQTLTHIENSHINASEEIKDAKAPIESSLHDSLILEQKYMCQSDSQVRS